MVKARSKRRPAKRGAKKRATRGKKSVRLTPVRTAVKQKIRELKRLEQTPRVTEAIGKMEECLAQFSQICGEVMIFPAR
jgi:hypothetical protein